jgi:hypothetical protein
MKVAVYPFGQVVRSLRIQAGVPILRARELTQYKNYERWESGDTRVGADHLHNIAVAFGVGDDLWLLVFAWLADRFTPGPEEEPVEFTGAQLRRHLDSLPTYMVDFGDHANLALSPMSHRDLALLAFTARYGRGYAREGESLVLAPAERARVPDPAPADVPVLSATYGDARRDLGEYVARTLILGGLRQLGRKPQRQVDRYMLLLLAEPDYIGRIIAAGAPPPHVRARGLMRLARLANRVGPSLQRMAERKLESLRREGEARRGAPVTLDEIKAMIRQMARDDALWESQPDSPAAEHESPALADPDPKLTRQLQVLHDQVDRAARRALAEELDDARATAAPRAAVDAIRVLGVESAGTES